MREVSSRSLDGHVVARFNAAVLADVETTDRRPTPDCAGCSSLDVHALEFIDDSPITTDIRFNYIVQDDP